MYQLTFAIDEQTALPYPALNNYPIIKIVAEKSYINQPTD